MNFLQRWRKSPKPCIAGPTANTCEPQVIEAITAALQSGAIDEARILLNEALHVFGDDPVLRLNSAKVYRLSGAPLEGLSECERALPYSQAPSLVQTEMGECMLSLPNLDGAIDHFNVAVTLDETNGGAWKLLGEALGRQGQHTASIEAFQNAIKLLTDPKQLAKTWFLLGQEYMYTICIPQAEEAFQQCLALTPDDADAYNGLGTAALWLDNEPQAVHYLREAVQRSPRPGRLLLLNLGAALQNCGEFSEAQRLIERVVVEHPHDHTSRWYMSQLDLTLCRWGKGWANYSARFGSGATAYRPMPYAPWDGRGSGGGTLLVLADEGIGDEIMYSSCLVEASRLVENVIVECELRLENIFRRSFPQVHFVGTRRENSSDWLRGLPIPDWQIPSGALPSLFRRTDESFPRHQGYLQAAPDRIAFWKERLDRELGSGLKVGISWRGGTIKTRARTRTPSPESWGPILSVPSVHFINLQYGQYRDELETLEHLHDCTIHDYPEAIQDYDETAALVGSLDLVVSVCTAIVHLAGALGRPVWVLTPLSPGWRYTANRASMPWYPSSRLFRQSTWGEWQQVCQELAVALRGMTISVSP